MDMQTEVETCNRMSHCIPLQLNLELNLELDLERDLERDLSTSRPLTFDL
eukprot:gene187-3575_t